MRKETTTTKGKKIFTNTIVLVSSKVLASISVILLFIILSHHFSPSDYGSFRQLWLINKGLILEVFSLGIPLTIFYFLPQLTSDEQKAFLIRTIVILSLIGFIASGLIIVGAPYIAHLFNNPNLEYLLKIFSLYPLFSLPTLAVEGTLISIDKVLQFSIFTIIDRILLFAFSLFSITVWQSLHAFCISLLFYSLLRLIISIGLVVFYFRNHRSKSHKISLSSQFRVGLPTGLSSIIGLVNVEFDKIIISSFFNVSRFAVYANGAFNIPFMGTVLSSISSILMPEFVKLKQNDKINKIIELWHNAIHKIALLFIPFMVFFLVIAEDFITLMFSDKYAESALVFQIYLTGIVANLTWYNVILVSLGHSREPFFASLIGLVSNVVLNYALILSVGFPGPAIASVITSYIVSAYYLYKLKCITNIGWKYIYPWKLIFCILTLSIFPTALIIPITYYDIISSKILRIMLCGSIYFSTTFSLLYLFKQINNADINLLKQFINNSTGRIFNLKV